MTKSEGMTKSECRTRRPHISEQLDIRASDFFRHWSLVIRHSTAYTPRLMMSEFDEELAARLRAVREQGLYRELPRIHSPQLPHTQVDGKTLLNFSSNDYLGLANDPLLKEAAIKGIE